MGFDGQRIALDDYSLELQARCYRKLYNKRLGVFPLVSLLQLLSRTRLFHRP